MALPPVDDVITQAELDEIARSFSAVAGLTQ